MGRHWLFDFPFCYNLLYFELDRLVIVRDRQRARRVVGLSGYSQQH